jgi:hypothetical protein
MTHPRLPASIRCQRHLLKAVAVFLVVAGTLSVAGNVQADQSAPPALRIEDTLHITPQGDAVCVRQGTLTAKDYAAIKEAKFSANEFANLIGLDQPDWLPPQDLQKNGNDAANTVRLRWTTRGLARRSDDHIWEIPLAGNQARPVSIRDREIVVALAGQWQFGPTERTVRITLPDGSSDVQLLNGPARLVYRLSTQFLEGDNPSVRVKLEPRPHLLSCLAKVYANPKFGLWAGRMEFTNTGNQSVNDYRVRFQVVGYSLDWGPWQRCPRVSPGQTVVHAYYPVLDIDKVARLEEVRAVYLKAEYQYRRRDGHEVRETETAQFELLGHNQVEFGSKKPERGYSMRTVCDLVPYTMASLVAYQDPAIQQLAGRVCRRVGGASAIYAEKEALKFMKGLYDFMATYISYQSPTSYRTDWGVRQHVMFGRDVLANHSGTCIELGILYASACEAVGLEPLLVSIPGHVFPGVRLVIRDNTGKVTVDKTWFVEVTQIGKIDFRKALEMGHSEFQGALKNRANVFVTDIKDMRAKGVYPLELPAVPATWLNKVCPEKQQVKPRSRSIAGTWRTVYGIDDDKIVRTLTLKADGRYTVYEQNQHGRARRYSGRYRYANGVLTCRTPSSDAQGKVTWVNDNKIIYTDSQGRLEYRRVR